MSEGRCSFCGKTKSEVKGMVAGPPKDTYICDECVALCVEILDDRTNLRLFPQSAELEALLVLRFLQKYCHTTKPLDQITIGDLLRVFEREAMYLSSKLETLPREDYRSCRRHSWLDAQSLKPYLQVLGGDADTVKVGQLLDLLNKLAGRLSACQSDSLARELSAHLPLPSVDEADTVAELRKKTGRVIDLNELQIKPAVLEIVPREICEKHNLIPLWIEGRILVVAVADNSTTFTREDVQVLSGYHVEWLMASESQIQAAIQRYYVLKDTERNESASGAPLRRRPTTSDRVNKVLESALRGQSSTKSVTDLSDEEKCQILAEQYGVPGIDLDEFEIDAEIIYLVPCEACEKHLVVPVNRAGNSLIIAMADPSNIFAIDDVKFLTGYNIEVVVATEAQIRTTIRRYYAADYQAPVNGGGEEEIGMSQCELDAGDIPSPEVDSPTSVPGISGKPGSGTRLFMGSLQQKKILPLSFAEQQELRQLSASSGIEAWSLQYPQTIDSSAIEFLPRDFCLVNKVVSIAWMNQRLVVALASSPSDFVLYQLEEVTGSKFLLVLAHPRQIDEVLALYYPAGKESEEPVLMMPLFAGLPVEEGAPEGVAAEAPSAVSGAPDLEKIEKPADAPAPPDGEKK